MLFSLGCAVGSQGLRPASTLELCLRCRSTSLTYSVNEKMPTWWAGISRQAGCAGAPPVAPGGGRFRWRLGAWTQRVPLASPRAEESSSHGNGLFGCGTNGLPARLRLAPARPCCAWAGIWCMPPPPAACPAAGPAASSPARPPERYSRAPPAPGSQGHLSGRRPRPKARAQTARRITSATAAGSAVATAREPPVPAGYALRARPFPPGGRRITGRRSRRWHDGRILPGGSGQLPLDRGKGTPDRGGARDQVLC